jgi:hypothetical protein
MRLTACQCSSRIGSSLRNTCERNSRRGCLTTCLSSSQTRAPTLGGIVCGVRWRGRSRSAALTAADAALGPSEGRPAASVLTRNSSRRTCRTAGESSVLSGVPGDRRLPAYRRAGRNLIIHGALKRRESRTLATAIFVMLMRIPIAPIPIAMSVPIPASVPADH